MSNPFIFHTNIDIIPIDIKYEIINYKNMATKETPLAKKPDKIPERLKQAQIMNLKEILPPEEYERVMAEAEEAKKERQKVKERSLNPMGIKTGDKLNILEGGKEEAGWEVLDMDPRTGKMHLFKGNKFLEKLANAEEIIDANTPKSERKTRIDMPTIEVEQPARLKKLPKSEKATKQMEAIREIPFKIGDKLNVERTGGKIDKDWKVSQIDFDSMRVEVIKDNLVKKPTIIEVIAANNPFKQNKPISLREMPKDIEHIGRRTDGFLRKFDSKKGVWQVETYIKTAPQTYSPKMVEATLKDLAAINFFEYQPFRIGDKVKLEMPTKETKGKIIQKMKVEDDWTVLNINSKQKYIEVMKGTEMKKVPIEKLMEYQKKEVTG